MLPHFQNSADRSSRRKGLAKASPSPHPMGSGRGERLRSLAGSNPAAGGDDSKRDTRPAPPLHFLAKFSLHSERPTLKSVSFTSKRREQSLARPACGYRAVGE